MKEAYWGYWLIVLGVFIIVVLLLVQNYTSTNSQDFYLVKEIAEAAMEDALDYGYYRAYGEAKINKEKFYESFIRRFSEEASLSTTYDIEFTEVFEAPPKIGVKVSSKSNTFSVFGDSESFDIVHKLDAILESKIGSSSVNYTGNSSTFQGGTTTDYVENYFEKEYTTDDFVNYVCRDVNSNKNVKIEVDYCGILNKNGVELVDNAKEGEIYCVAHYVGNATYLVVAPKASFEEMYCNEGYVANGDSSVKPDDDDKPVATPTSSVCEEGVIASDLTGQYGVAMQSSKYYKDAGRAEEIGTMPADGTKFLINGSNGSNWVQIEYKGQCAWVNSDYIAVNGKTYLKNVEFNITNASKSLYKSSGVSIKDVTGKPLYKSEFKDFVPITYTFAKKLKIAAENAKAAGDTLKVYDAYRPQSVTAYVYPKYQALVGSNKTVLNGVSNWGYQTFFAQSISTHNTGCAVDVTLSGREGEMPSKMHELSELAIKYTYSLCEVGRDGCVYSDGMKNSAAAMDLHEYMTTGTGLTDLASEWWHFHDKNCTVSTPANFWSAV